MTHTLQVDSVNITVANKTLIHDCFLKCGNEVVGILGRNGTGKSLLFQSIFGTYSPESIGVIVNGRKVKYPYKEGLTGYLPQKNFIPRSIRVKEVFDDFGVDPSRFLTHFSLERPLLSQKVSQLSLGTLRLLEFYVTIKGAYPFVLLDEPFTHISPLNIDLICELIKTESRKKGIILTDAIQEYVEKVSDVVYMLEEGVLRALNTASGSSYKAKV